MITPNLAKARITSAADQIKFRADKKFFHAYNGIDQCLDQ